MRCPSGLSGASYGGRIIRAALFRARRSCQGRALLSSPLSSLLFLSFSFADYVLTYKHKLRDASLPEESRPFSCLTIFFFLLEISFHSLCLYSSRTYVFREKRYTRESGGIFKSARNKISTGTKESFSSTDDDDGEGRRKRCAYFLVVSRDAPTSLRYVYNFQYLFPTYLSLSLSLTRISSA